MFRRKPEIVLITKAFVDKKFVGETAKVVRRGPDWLMRGVLAVVIPYGLWLMVMKGMF